LATNENQIYEYGKFFFSFSHFWQLKTSEITYFMNFKLKLKILVKFGQSKNNEKNDKWK
jgi:hypothetical protein